MTLIRSAFTMFKSSDFIIIQQSGMILGFNNELSILKTTQFPMIFPEHEFVCITKSTASIKTEGNFILDNGIIIHETCNDSNLYLHHLKYEAMQRYFNMMNDITVSVALYKNEPINIEDLHNNESFKNEVMTLKASTGSIIYKALENYKMTLYIGILPITKADKVSLSIYPLDSYNFISQYRIKKKTGVMDVYIRYLNI